MTAMCKPYVHMHQWVEQKTVVVVLVVVVVVERTG